MQVSESKPNQCFSMLLFLNSASSKFLKNYMFGTISENYLSQTQFSNKPGSHFLRFSKPLLGRHHIQVVRISNKSRDFSLFFLGFRIKNRGHSRYKTYCDFEPTIRVYFGGVRRKYIHVLAFVASRLRPIRNIFSPNWPPI